MTTVEYQTTYQSTYQFISKLPISHLLAVAVLCCAAQAATLAVEGDADRAEIRFDCDARAVATREADATLLDILEAGGRDSTLVAITLCDASGDSCLEMVMEMSELRVYLREYSSRDALDRAAVDMKCIRALFEAHKVTRQLADKRAEAPAEGSEQK
ncbi:MAG: hypothetical protein GF331_26285 [Chitinivibrionales bacterium]|nr:hypothetical protein [Chitinivibrionales bacterium]